MGKLIHISLGWILTSCAFAQSAASFDPKANAPASRAPEPEKAAKPVPKETGPANTMPSRLVGPDTIEAYVDTFSSMFLIHTRERDPFGQSQDPDAKPVAPVSTVARATIHAPTVIPFSEIVGRIVVNTIMPGEKRFLLNNRSFKEGDQIPFIFRNKTVHVLVTEVTSRQISFRNVETGETASRRLDALPTGMTPGTRGITAPGMAPDRPNTPIELEPGDPAP